MDKAQIVEKNWVRDLSLAVILIREMKRKVSR